MDSFLRRVVTQRNEEQARDYDPRAERYHRYTDKTRDIETLGPEEDVREQDFLGPCRCGHFAEFHRTRHRHCALCLCVKFERRRTK